MTTKTPNTNDFKGLTDWTEIFRTGKQTDSADKTRHFTESDLDEVAANHSPDQPVPDVVIHKELYRPLADVQSHEFNWDDLSLLVKSDKVDLQFDTLLKTGQLFNRSVSLGAKPSAVDGLPAFEYASDGEFFDYVSDWEYGDTMGTIARMFRRIHTLLVGRFDGESADRALPEHEIDDLSEQAIRAKFSPEPDTSTAPLSNTDNPILNTDYVKAVG